MIADWIISVAENTRTRLVWANLVLILPHFVTRKSYPELLVVRFLGDLYIL